MCSFPTAFPQSPHSPCRANRIINFIYTYNYSNYLIFLTSSSHCICSLTISSPPDRPSGHCWFCFYKNCTHQCTFVDRAEEKQGVLSGCLLPSCTSEGRGLGFSPDMGSPFLVLSRLAPHVPVQAVLGPLWDGRWTSLCF